MARFRITHHETRKSIEIVRDVRHQHPEWVHEQMGTSSEAELQMALDQYDIDAYRLNPGPDCCGVEMIDDSMLDDALGIESEHRQSA